MRCEKRKKSFQILCILSLFFPLYLLVPFCFAEAQEQPVIEILFLHNNPCESCDEGGVFRSLLKKTVSEETMAHISVSDYCVYLGEGRELASRLAAANGIKESELSYPTAIIGDQVLTGYDQMEKSLLNVIQEVEASGDVTPFLLEREIVVEEEGEILPREEEEAPFLFFLKTVGVGFLNGFNICSLSIVLMFFSMLGMMKKGWLCCGLAFIAGKWTAYTFLGFAASHAFSAIPSTWFGTFHTAVKYVLIVVCFLLATGNFLDAYYARKGEYGKIRMQLPRCVRSSHERLIKRLTSGVGRFLPLCIFAGSMLIACGDFFCTGQIYLISILQWMETSPTGGVPTAAFILYSAALCLPSLLILVLIRGGKSAYTLASSQLRHMPVVKIAFGMMLLIFGVLFLLL